jgi:hypothetical protein
MIKRVQRVTRLTHQLGRVIFDQNTHVVPREFMQKSLQTSFRAWFSPVSIDTKT